MSDFFESENGTSALAGMEPINVVDREMRRQELRRANTRRLATGVISAVLAGTVLLGGGFAAYGATHKAPAKVTASSTKKHVKSAKHKKHKKQEKKRHKRS